MNGTTAFATTSTGVRANLEEFGFTAYPNPASASINIRLAGATDANYSIIDVTGKQMVSGSIQNGESTVSLSELPSGIYIIKATAGERSVTKKIIKQ